MFIVNKHDWVGRVIQTVAVVAQNSENARAIAEQIHGEGDWQAWEGRILEDGSLEGILEIMREVCSWGYTTNPRV